MKNVLLIFLMLFCILNVNGQNNPEKDIKESIKSAIEIDSIPEKKKLVASRRTFEVASDSTTFYQKEITYEFLKTKKENTHLIKIDINVAYVDNQNTIIKERLYVKTKKMIYFISEYHAGGERLSYVEGFLIVDKKNNSMTFHARKDGVITLSKKEREAILGHIEAVLEEYRNNCSGNK